MDGITDHKYPHCEIATVQQPERPAPEPPVAFLESQRDDSLIENITQDWTIVSPFYHTRQSHCKLDVIQMTEADVHSIFQAISKDEECGRVFWRLPRKSKSTKFK